MLIRRATPADLESIIGFNAAMARETEGKVLEPFRLRDGVKAVLQREDLGFYLMAEVDGQAVGQLLVTTEWSDWRNAFFWWVQSVYVRPDYRRMGVYRALDQEVRVEAGRRGNVCGIRLYVDGENLTAQQVYRRLGMSQSRYHMYEIEFD